MSALFPLELSGAVASRRGKRLVGPVDLTLTGHGTVMVIGPNGSGKTSLLRLMHGTARLSAGRLRWACTLEDARHRQGFVFQKPIMLRRSVEENLIYPLRLRKVARGAAKQAAQDWAARVGLGAMLGRPAHVLSGGEQQKLTIARALITNPDVLFLDEPTASLDGTATREIEEILLVAKQSGTVLIMATHDMGQAQRIGDEVLFVHGGQVVEHEPVSDFFAGPKSAAAQAFLRGDIVE